MFYLYIKKYNNINNNLDVCFVAANTLMPIPRYWWFLVYIWNFAMHKVSCNVWSCPPWKPKLKKWKYLNVPIFNSSDTFFPISNMVRGRSHDTFAFGIGIVSIVALKFCPNSFQFRMQGVHFAGEICHLLLLHLFVCWASQFFYESQFVKRIDQTKSVCQQTQIVFIILPSSPLALGVS